MAIPRPDIKSHFRFLDLPAEIRLMIYHLALADDRPLKYIEPCANFELRVELGLLLTCKAIYLEAIRSFYTSNHFIIFPKTGYDSPHDLRHMAAQRGMVYDRLNDLSSTLPHLRLRHLEIPDRNFNAYEPYRSPHILCDLVDMVPELEILSLACSRRPKLFVPYRDMSQNFLPGDQFMFGGGCSAMRGSTKGAPEAEDITHVLRLLFWLINLREAGCLRAHETGKLLQPQITAALCSRLPVSPSEQTWMSTVARQMFGRTRKITVPRGLKEVRVLGYNMGFMPWVQILANPEARALWNPLGMLSAKPLSYGEVRECNVLVKWMSKSEC
ncbi:MAG: hypothetical protein Q9227_008501 [Pyrenula ochraceoflavens]